MLPPRAIVIGSGPNGLAAAIVLAERGVNVSVIEAAETVGGGCRSAELTLPGFTHDTCSTSFPLAAASRFFRHRADTLQIDWIEPPVAVAHPFDDGQAALLWRSIDSTAIGLGPDRDNYLRLFSGPVQSGAPLLDELLSPLSPRRVSPAMARMGAVAILPAVRLARREFTSPRAQALFAGSAAHSMQSLASLGSSAAGLVLHLAAHTAGWPHVHGGAQRLVQALHERLVGLGGVVEVGRTIKSVSELPPNVPVLLDVAAEQLLALCGNRLPVWYRHAIRWFHRGPAVFKIDYAMADVIPWQAVDCGLAGTVHLGGSLEEIAASAAAVAAGFVSQRPLVLVAQPTRFDSSRAPAGRHVAWAYCHVPNGWKGDAQRAIEAQIERFAPGFQQRVLARNVMTPDSFASYNLSYSGGDISGGAANLRQLLSRPIPFGSPYRVRGLPAYLCSSSTPPGPGVHGLCGLNAAELLLEDHSQRGQPRFRR